MSTLFLVMEKELRELIGNLRYLVVFAFCAGLTLLSFYMGAENYRTALARHETAVQENLRQIEGLTDWMSVRNHRIFLPPQPLEALVTGVSNDIGRRMEVYGRGELTPEGSRFNDEPLYAVFRFLDLDFLFQVVFSLFAILFAYDAISGEKERGTLRLAFAGPVSRNQYLLGKLLGAGLGIGGPLLVAVLTGCLFLPAFGVPLTADDWLRLGLIIFTGFVYLGVFIALSVCVSALTRRSSSSFVLLLMVWIGSALIGPRASVALAGRMVDVPGLDEIATQKSRYSRELWTEDRETLASYKPPPGAPEDMARAFQEFMTQQTEARDRKLQTLADALNRERFNRQEEQRQLAFGLARIFPPATFSLAVTALAGTTPGMGREFLESASAHQQKYAAFMKEKTGMTSSRAMIYFRSVTDGERPQPIDPREMPVFEHTPAGSGAVLAESLPDMGLLVFYLIIFFLGAYIAFLRYDVR